MMNFKKSVIALSTCAAALCMAPAHAWTVPVGTPTDSCVNTYSQGNSTLFTLYTETYSPDKATSLYTYSFNLYNNSDSSNLTTLAINPGNTPLDYFIGFGPFGSTALHDSAIGDTSSPQSVSNGQTTGGPATWSAGVYKGYTYFTADTAGISKGGSLSSEYQKTFQFNGTHTAGYLFFVQSSTALNNPIVLVGDKSGKWYSTTTCITPGGNGVPAVPEPGTLMPFAFGGLGILLLSARKRSQSAA